METLNEALKIAALDIAAAASEQLQSDEEADHVPDAQVSKPARTSRQKKMVVKTDGSYSSVPVTADSGQSRAE